MEARLRFFFFAVFTAVCANFTIANAQGLADLLDKDELDAASRPVAAAKLDAGNDERARSNGQKGGMSIAAEERRAAATRVRDIFSGDVRQAKTPGQKAAIAKSMTQLASEATNSAEALVLLESAFSLAIDAQDASTMDAAAALLAEMFGLDLTEQRRGALITMCKKAATEDLEPIIDALVSEAQEAAEAGFFEIAQEVSKAAAVAARRLRDQTRQKTTAELLQRVKEMEKMQASIQPLIDRLKKNPRDEQALVELGQYRCYEEGNWEAGLQLLANCSDAALAKAARTDLAVDGSATSHAKAGDMWFALNAEQATKGPRGPSERAKYHYERAMTNATGLARAQILKRLDEITKLEGGADSWIVIFRSDDPSIWNTKVEDGFLRFSLPLNEVPATVRYVRIRRPNGNSIVFPMTKQQLATDVYGARYGWRGGSSRLLNDTFLGVCDLSKIVSKNDVGKVFVGNKEGVMFSGWGFGHKFKSGKQTSIAWNGATIPRELLEISVLCRELSAKERQQAKILQ